MRMRKKPNLIPRMERCRAVWVQEPEQYKGRWLEAFPHTALHVELGCGKGRFTAEMAANHPEVLFVAVERVPEALVMAMERVVAAGRSNVLFLSEDAARLTDFFASGEIHRLYINFCDPWPGKKHAKRRLTAPPFLTLYAPLLAADGEIWFKTDNRPLFDFSLESFAQCGYQVSEVTYDLHENGPVGCMTNYEEKFYQQGVPICRMVAKKTEGTVPGLAEHHKNAGMDG